MNFHLPSLKAFDGSTNLIEYTVAFHAKCARPMLRQILHSGGVGQNVPESCKSGNSTYAKVNLHGRDTRPNAPRTCESKKLDPYEERNPTVEAQGQMRLRYMSQKNLIRVKINLLRQIHKAKYAQLT